MALVVLASYQPRKSRKPWINSRSTTSRQSIRPGDTYAMIPTQTAFHHHAECGLTSKQPNSEATLGQQDAPKTFTIHTKALSNEPGCMSKQAMLNNMEVSLKELGVDSVSTRTDDPSIRLLLLISARSICTTSTHQTTRRLSRKLSLPFRSSMQLGNSRGYDLCMKQVEHAER